MKSHSSFSFFIFYAVKKTSSGTFLMRRPFFPLKLFLTRGEKSLFDKCRPSPSSLTTFFNPFVFSSIIKTSPLFHRRRVVSRYSSVFDCISFIAGGKIHSRLCPPLRGPPERYSLNRRNRKPGIIIIIIMMCGWLYLPLEQKVVSPPSNRTFGRE